MQAVLFDLDGTLLDIDLEAFLGRYFRELEVAMTPLLSGGMTGQHAIEALNAATASMMKPHPGESNKDVFHREFERLSGVDLDASWSVFEDFYADRFPRLRGECGPKPGVSAAITAVRELGMRIAIATNPIFPEAAVRHRLAWAGLSDGDYDVVTTYENMTACKPHPDYFRQTASMLGVPADGCMMVGDDRFLDLAAADVGMRTFYVGTSDDALADYRGTLLELAELLPRLRQRQ